jgi:hypothetical protein
MAYLLQAQRLRGCIFVEDPSVGAPTARLLWTADVDPGVLQVEAVLAPTGSDDSFDLGRFGEMAIMVRDTGGCEHIAISDGYRRIRVDVVSGSMLNGPVLLHHQLMGVDRLDEKLLGLRRLIALHRHGRLVPSLFPVSLQTIRIVAALRIYDALAAGASQRDMAVALFGWDTVEADWAAASDYLRLRVRRLVRLARRLATGGWMQLLR